MEWISEAIISSSVSLEAMFVGRSFAWKIDSCPGKFVAR